MVTELLCTQRDFEQIEDLQRLGKGFVEESRLLRMEEYRGIESKIIAKVYDNLYPALSIVEDHQLWRRLPLQPDRVKEAYIEYETERRRRVNAELSLSFIYSYKKWSIPLAMQDIGVEIRRFYAIRPLSLLLDSFLKTGGVKESDKYLVAAVYRELENIGERMRVTSEVARRVVAG